MNRSLRRRHRTMIVALAVVAPALFVAGLSVRQSIPHTAGSPVRHATSDSLLVAVGEETVSDELPIRVRWLRTRGAAARHAVGLELLGPLKQPDLLVYWDEGADAGSEPSDTARLLGRVGERLEVVWEVPDPDSTGRLVFYSTAWKELSGSVEPPSGWGVTP